MLFGGTENSKSRAKIINSSDVAEGSTSAPALNFYESFLLKNANQIGSIESAINSLSYILPGRFKDVEIASESLCSGLHILSLYHDSILVKTTAKLAQRDRTIRPSLHNKYTGYFTISKKNPSLSKYRIVVGFLTLIQSTQLLWEMIAKKHQGQAPPRRFPQLTRWRIILLLELIKALCRLSLLKSTQGRPLMSPPIPEREIDPAQLSYDLNGQLTLAESDADSQDCKMPRTGHKVPLEPVLDARQYLASRVLGADDVNAPQDLVRVLKGKGVQAAEIIYVLRPLVYAVLLYSSKCSLKKQGQIHRTKWLKWSPWIIGIAMDYLSRRIIQQSYDKPTTLEAEMLAQRWRSMAWWSLRGPAYESVLRPWVAALISRTQHVPGVNFFTAIVDDYLYLLDNYYFAASTL
ncbi:peroxisomal membrane protein PEX16 [Nadsonia fulvescens var. elongata DSM 6958]|uniref:Peroxisomal membrane protein PEX16 n=1 Tax=Nadsonia fulvescens var. elongata DSM 6958 TaxID=857566 RepID=A0A1E3PSX8_9ASCO|nr:peroxisomal membrane protein PEX16 [Nadsonia fulvescens var. elongata DSM 6958]